MSIWNAGYVSDIPYTFGCYPELNPRRVALAFLRAGLKPPAIRTACELGIGQGVSTNIHAAASDVEWHGNDFNPSHAAFAAGLAASAGSKTHIYDDSFEEFANRDDLPQFDFIGLHGVWSWISDANRSHIVRFIQKRLRVGGVLYVSYNSLPGWNYFLPIRQLMADYADQTQGSAISTAARVGAAMNFVERYIAAEPTLIRQAPTVPERFKKINEQNRHYLAHEYFNRDWRPMYFREVADQLTAAKLDFVGSAHYLDQIDAVNLTNEQLALLNEQPNWLWRETLRDFVTCQQFRRDYWVRGSERLTPLEQQAALAAHRVMLVMPADKISLTVNGLRGEGSLSADIYRPLLDLLGDFKPRSLAEIHDALKGRLSMPQIAEAVTVLCGDGKAASVADPAEQDAALPMTRRLNQRFADMAKSQSDVLALASPVTGGGIPADRFEQIFVEACWHGKQDAPSLAAHAYGFLEAQGQKIVKDGKLLATADENRQDLLSRAEAFVQYRLPLMRALRIC
jgi:hypothetical protein